MARRSPKRPRRIGAASSTGDSPRAEPHPWSARSKVAVVLEMLQGADVAAVGQRYNVATSDLLRWRDAFLVGGEARLAGAAPAAEPPGSLRRLVAVLEADGDGDQWPRIEKHRERVPRRGRSNGSRR